MTLLKVEIVTPVHNRLRETIRCLHSLARVDTTGLAVHVIIVDDGSTDGTAEAVLAEFPDVEIVQGDGNLWYTAGTNRGLSAALRRQPDYILAINNDSIFDEKCIVNMVKCAEAHSRSIVGAVLLNWDTPHQVVQVSPRWELWKGGFRHWYRQTVWTLPPRPWEVEIIVGNCVLYPAASIKECGLMDEKRLVHWGDAEYTPRMRRRGWRLLIEPTARVFCKPNDPASGFRKLPFRTQFDHLFRNPTSPYSLRKRFYATVGSAPNRFLGFVAVPIFFVRYFAGRNQEGQWAIGRDEAPLSETFADSTLDE
jgi:GT2 family glycosyltransferase